MALKWFSKPDGANFLTKWHRSVVSWIIEINILLNGFKSFNIGVYTNAHGFLICQVICIWWIRFYRPIRVGFFPILPEVSDPWCSPKGSQPLRTRLCKGSWISQFPFYIFHKQHSSFLIQQFSGLKLVKEIRNEPQGQSAGTW